MFPSAFSTAQAAFKNVITYEVYNDWFIKIHISSSILSVYYIQPHAKVWSIGGLKNIQMYNRQIERRAKYIRGRLHHMKGTSVLK